MTTNDERRGHVAPSQDPGIFCKIAEKLARRAAGALTWSTMRPGDVSTVLSRDDSGGAVAIDEVSVPAAWPGEPFHHHEHDEAIHVLAGADDPGRWHVAYGRTRPVRCPRRSRARARQPRSRPGALPARDDAAKASDPAIVGPPIRSDAATTQLPDRRCTATTSTKPSTSSRES